MLTNTREESLFHGLETYYDLTFFEFIKKDIPFFLVFNALEYNFLVSKLLV
jgi:hypothetical protein